MAGKKRLSEQQIDEAVRMRVEDGMRQQAIAQHFRVSTETMAMYLRDRLGPCRTHVVVGDLCEHDWSKRAPIVPACEHDARDFFAELRRDASSRSLVSAMCGDPPPGRSALDQRNGGDRA
jgi:hypothetical protein